VIGWAYWLLVAGVVVMVSDLTVAGLVESKLWQSTAPWMESVRAARPYWLIRTLTFVPIGAGFVLLLAGLLTGNPGDGLRAVQQEVGLEPVEEIAPRLAPEVL
jgi:cbb3-type cytochrome oxidase subunit 1